MVQSCKQEPEKWLKSNASSKMDTSCSGFYDLNGLLVVGISKLPSQAPRGCVDFVTTIGPKNNFPSYIMRLPTSSVFL